MDERQDWEAQEESEREKRKQKAARRKKTVRTEIMVLAVIGIFITAGLVFALARVRGNTADTAAKVAAGTDYTDTGQLSAGGPDAPADTAGWDEIDSVETFAEAETPRETLEAGHISEDIPKIDVIVSVQPVDSDWTPYAADNRCLLAPKGSYLVGMKASLRNQPEGMTGTVQYSANISGYGWLDWLEDSAEAKDTAGTATLEAIKMQLSGELAEHYDILYCVYQNGRWTDWVENGETAGEEGVGLRIDGIRASVARKIPGEASYAGEINPNRPMVALTYDDGPSKSVTPRILDKLESVGGHATFFMVGEQAERNPDIVMRIATMGCEVANHTFDHIEMNKLTDEGLWNEIEKTSQVIYNICGIRPLIVRPPGGNETSSGMEVLGALAMPAIIWSVDTRDWKTRDAAQTISTVLNNVSDGDIVLMHDLYDATGEASMTIIDELVSRGYQLVTVSELSAYRGGLEPGKSYQRFRK